MRLLRWLVSCVLAGACACGDSAAPKIPDDAAPRRTVTSPSRVEARAIPPHDIHSEGVGPYLLGASLRSILSTLPHGPRVELMQLEGIADHSLVRAEGEKVVLGVQKPKGVTFITVLAPSIARTEKEVGVGTPLRVLEERHGQLFRERGHASDPRILRVQALPTVRFVTARGRVIAVVVVSAPVQGGEREPSNCDVESLRARESEVIGAARLGSKVQVSYGCFGSAEPGAFVVRGQRIVMVQMAGDELKRGASTAVPGLIFAAPLEVDDDDRDEILAVVQGRKETLRTISVHVLRADAGRLSTLVKQKVYELDDAAVSWQGAKPGDIDFLVEADARGGLVTVSGLYLHRSLLGARDVVPLSPVPVVVPQRKVTGPASGRSTATSPDGGSIRPNSP